MASTPPSRRSGAAHLATAPGDDSIGPKTHHRRECAIPSSPTSAVTGITADGSRMEWLKWIQWMRWAGPGCVQQSGVRVGPGCEGPADYRHTDHRAIG